MLRSRSILFAAGLAALVLLGVGAISASAHEPRDVGDYSFLVGWAVEPTYTGQMNGVSLTVAKKAAAEAGATTAAPTAMSGMAASPTAAEGGDTGDDDKMTGTPVTGLEKTLKLEVMSGGITKTLALEPVYDKPGGYTAALLPTKEGDYRFRFTGTVEGQPVDETFDSADGKFDPATSLAEVSFPAAGAAPAATAVQGAVQTADAQVAAAQAAADSSRTLAIAALFAGVVALVLAAVALRRAGQKA